jgi:predicted metal-dependent hydrolase
MLELISKQHPIPYSIRLSARAKRMRIAVYSDSSVVLTLPHGLNFGAAEKFIAQKFSWIVKSLRRFEPFRHRVIIKSGRREYNKYRDGALALAKQKVLQWNQIYNFNINRVNIKNQKTRWGSCSKKGNLNFNYKIVHLPEKLVDYLVVHELCHLKEFNHSKNFWALVANAIPDYKALRSQLRSFGNLQ